MDIVPSKLNELYKDDRYDKLIIGYVKNAEKNYDLSYSLPFSLHNLMLQYYPCFLY